MAVETAAGFQNLNGGMHSGIDPLILGEQLYAQGINISSREGLVHSRPGWGDTGATTNTDTFQGAARWSLNSGDRFVYVRAGRLYSMKLNNYSITDHGLLFDTSAQCHFVQADRYMTIQDGVSLPQALEEVAGVATIKDITAAGLSVVAALPTGLAMAYVHGRIHVTTITLPSTALNGRPYFLSGDISKPNAPDDCYKFTETDFLNGGGAHGLPMEMGYVNGFGALRNAATGTGVGALIVFGENGVSAFDMSIPRTLWSDQPLAQVLFFGPGTTSPWSILPVNNDLVYRAADGLRILKYTASQLAGGSALANTPQSNEVSTYMDGEPASYLPYVSSAMVDNRLFMTVGGTDTRHFKAVVSMDLAQISGLSGASTPAYDGIWQLPTGVNFAQVLSGRVSGTPKLYAFGSDGKLYVLNPDATIDEGAASIRSRLVTKVYNFGDMVSWKEIQKVELWVKDLVRDTNITVYYRPHGYPLWISLGSKQLEVAAGSYPQRRQRLTFTLDKPGDYCDTATKKLLHAAEAFQFAIEWTGYMTIEVFRAEITADLDAPGFACDETSNEPIVESATSGVALGDYLT
jgi:hypothetical protein